MKSALSRSLRSIIFGLLATFLAWQPLTARGADDAPPQAAGVAKVPDNPFPNRVPAADLDGGVEWLNTSGPISMKDLRGKIVLLDFWTFCCINCMHVLPDLAYLEKKYDKQIVVIGVHSAKFDNEKETENIRKAILRYEIEHPVVNDANMTIWRKFGVRAWPTLVMLDPEGFYCGYVSGEGNREILDVVIGKVIDYHRAKGTLDETPVRFDLERNNQKPTPLKFPGKLLADTENDRLFISDSNNNRIVVTTLDGKLLTTIGSGQIGDADGAFAEAQFDHPQGMCRVGDQLYVADTENHLIRQVDLTKQTVTKLAGTGEQARGRSVGGKLSETPLNSPWDLEVVDGVMYIAMAGPHQIWSHRLGSDSVQNYAGSGREDIRNGPLDEAALAQPSDLIVKDTTLFVVDSEGSSVRAISTQADNDLDMPKGEVSTVVGTSDLPMGRCLFEFGDIDGVGADVRLQHPLGLALSGDTLFVADAYNHKVKAVDLKTRECTTWLGGGEGAGLDPVQMSEPAGLVVVGDSLLIADTNNHRILKADLKTKAVTLFEIPGLEPPASTGAVAADEPAGEAAIALNPVTISGDMLTIELRLDLPAEHKVNTATPVTVRLKPVADQMLIAADNLGVRHEVAEVDGRLQVKIPLAAAAGQGEYEVMLVVPYCREGVGGLCRLGQRTYRLPLVVTADGKNAPVVLSADFLTE
jgi:thiol-disulfide isomerase/thioredoxin